MTKKTEQDPFNAFGWDEETSEIDFFGEIEKSITPEKEEKAEEVEDVTDVTDPIEEKKEEEEDTDIFQEFEQVEEQEEDTDGEEEEKPADPDKDSPVNIKNSVKHLFDDGTLELDEEEELPEEIDSDYLKNKIEASIEKKFEESISDLPDDVKNIIRYVHNGGSLKDIVSTLTQETELSEDIDMEEEKNQEKVLRHLLKEEGEDEELIEAQVEFLKDSGKLSSISQKKFDKWKKDRKAQKKAKIAARENQAKFKKDISTLLSENPEVKGLSFSKKEIQELPSYISDTSVKLQDGRSITPFYRDLFESLKNPEELLAIAKLVKTKFDFSDIKKELSTKHSKKLKEDLQRQTDNKPKRSSQKTNRLIDYL